MKPQANKFNTPMHSLISYWIFQGILNKFSNSPVFQLAETPVETIFKTSNALSHKFLSWDEVDSICAKESLDGIIVLEYFVNDSIAGHMELIPKTGLYHADALLSYDLMGRVYNGFSHKIEDQHWQHDTLTWKGMSYNSNDAEQQLPVRRMPCLNRVTKPVKNTDSVLPSNGQRQPGYFFQRSNLDFRKASDFVETGN